LNEPTHLDLFSGIGGFAIAAQAAGFRTIAFVERDAYCQKILAQHWPKVPIFSDIHNFGGRPFRGASLLTGGFPCQPFSQAGQQRGKADDRYLWPEMFRVIQTTEPDWIIGENVAGLDGLGLDDCISDLESIGYEVAPAFEIPACGVGAWHGRIRVWIVANLNRKRQLQSGWSQQTQRGRIIDSASSNVRIDADASGERQEWRMPTNANSRNDEGIEARIRLSSFPSPSVSRLIGEHQPLLGRGIHGLPNRAHRVKALGNAIVPQVAFQIIKAIREQIS
jgi:DNA (cytosine-5)-methyltransferase 1